MKIGSLYQFNILLNHNPIDFCKIQNQSHKEIMKKFRSFDYDIRHLHIFYFLERVSIKNKIILLIDFFKIKGIKNTMFNNMFCFKFLVDDNIECYTMMDLNDFNKYYIEIKSE